MLILIFGSKSSFGDDFGQYDKKTIILGLLFGQTPLRNSVVMATPKVAGDQKLFERACYMFKLKVTKFQRPTPDGFWFVFKNQLAGKFATPPPPVKNWVKMPTICFPHSVTKWQKTYPSDKLNSPLRPDQSLEQDFFRNICRLCLVSSDIHHFLSCLLLALDWRWRLMYITWTFLSNQIPDENTIWNVTLHIKPKVSNLTGRWAYE